MLRDSRDSSLESQVELTENREEPINHVVLTSSCTIQFDQTPNKFYLHTISISFYPSFQSLGFEFFFTKFLKLSLIFKKVSQFYANFINSTPSKPKKPLLTLKQSNIYLLFSKNETPPQKMRTPRKNPKKCRKP